MNHAALETERGVSLWRDAWLRLRRNRLAVAGGVTLMLLCTLALLTPWIAPYDYRAQDLALGASPPSAAHWLGTDTLGRDLLTHVLWGGRLDEFLLFQRLYLAAHNTRHGQPFHGADSEKQ